jgi:hypothetical protein
MRRFARYILCILSIAATSVGLAATESSLTVSFFEPHTFPQTCEPPKNLPRDHGIAVSEGVFGLTCHDNWVYVPDPNNPQDVEWGDIRDAATRGHAVTSKREYLELAYQVCGGRCVQKDGGNFWMNLPRCNLPGYADTCDGRVYRLTSSMAPLASELVYMQSACPINHWKNLTKAAIGVDTNHCASPHADLSTSLRERVGANRARQEELRVTIERRDSAQVSMKRTHHDDKTGSDISEAEDCRRSDQRAPNSCIRTPSEPAWPVP